MTPIPLEITDSVQRTVRGWSLLRLEQIRRILHGIDPDSLGAHRVTELCDALRGAGALADPVLIDPRFGRWCAEMISLLDRGAPTLLPTGRYRAACRDAGAFTLAVRFRHGLDAAATAARIDYDGVLRLPGTGLVVCFGVEQAGLDASIEIKGGQLVPVDGTPTVRAEPAAMPGLVVPSGDPIDAGPCATEPLLMLAPPSVVVERGDIDLRGAVVPGIGVVPASAASIVRTGHAVASAAHRRAVVRGGQLFEPGASVVDPPPELAHIADAPHLVRLLALRGVLTAVVADDDLGEVLNLFARWLAAAGSLSPLGRELLTELSAYGYPATESRDDTGRQAEEPVAAAWAASWISAGGALRKPSMPMACLTVDDPELASLLADLGAPAGIDVNRVSDGRSRADPTIDHLSLISVREPERYAALVARLAAAPPGPVREILIGHVAYVEERFADAATAYAELLLRLPDDIDLWRDFVFTLRHLGSVELYETAVFRLGELVERAVTCQLDVATLERLRPDSGRWRSASLPVRLLVGLLEWMAHDSDHR